MELLKNKCYEKNNQSASISSHWNHSSNRINYFVFLLRSHSLLYCAVPKVATRTFLTFITYLYIRDELITSLTDNSSAYFTDHSNLFNEDYFNQMLSSSIKVNRMN